uniref:Uncharacterized protein n=1 Tax=Rhizophora mucronata TaxID=61149 RepID=A0A2P2P5L4_RHIMU
MHVVTNKLFLYRWGSRTSSPFPSSNYFIEKSLIKIR